MTEQQTAHHRKRGDQVNLTRPEVLAGIQAYTAEHQNDLLWLHGYAIDALHGSRSALCDFLGCDWTTIWRVWSGRYGADIAQFVERVRHFRRKSEIGARVHFVETVITEKIFKLCDLARDNGVIVMVSGGTGRSKTWSAREWQRRNNHGTSQYVYAPEDGGFRSFLEAIARTLGLSDRRNNCELMRAIENSLDYRNVLIVDEVVHLIPTGRASSLRAIEFIRGLHDRTGCGVVLVATDVFHQTLAGGRWSQWFEQLLGRVELHLRIPAEFTRREIADICSAYVDDPDTELLNLARKVANARLGGVRELFRHMNRAAQAAAKLGEPLAARHLAAAVEFQSKLLTLED